MRNAVGRCSLPENSICARIRVGGSTRGKRTARFIGGMYRCGYLTWATFEKRGTRISLRAYRGAPLRLAIATTSGLSSCKVAFGGRHFGMSQAPRT
jgi:hypothetical protein